MSIYSEKKTFLMAAILIIQDGRHIYTSGKLETLVFLLPRQHSFQKCIGLQVF